MPSASGPADEQYWDRYGPTPKAFVSLATGRRLWGSRFGQTTSIRVADEVRDAAGDGRTGGRLRVPRRSQRRTLSIPTPCSCTQRLDPAAMGFVFQPVKRQGLAAAAGTTPFGVLFLCFSFFIIAAAVMLVALLFRLGIERRAAQIGTLLAVGLSRRQVGRLLLGEGLVVAAAGSLLGVPAGIGYAALMLLGLRTWWLAAVVTPFLRLHVTAASLAIGCSSGLVVAAAAIWLSVRRIGRLPPRRLLAGQTVRLNALGVRRHGSTYSLARALLESLLLLLRRRSGAWAAGSGTSARNFTPACSLPPGPSPWWRCWRWSGFVCGRARRARPWRPAAAIWPAWPCATPPETPAAAR